MNQYVTGAIIKKLRERKDLTQAELAERTWADSDRTLLRNTPHASGGHIKLDLVIRQLDVGRHPGGNRNTQDRVFGKPSPFACLVDGVDQRYLIFAVQRFRNLRRQRCQGAVAVGGEVGAVGGIDADHGVSPPHGQNESVTHVGQRLIK